MTSPQTTGYLTKLFEEHGVPCVVENDWVVPNSELPALRALWHPASSNGRLDVQALISNGVLIEECFGGVGDGQSGADDALANFTINSFHVLLAALWGKNDPSQVTTEAWEVHGKRYTAYVGNFGTRSSKGVTPKVPHELFAGIEGAIKLESLAADIHWFRVFFCNVAGSFTFEALKDNDAWAAGMRHLESVTWEKSDGYYSVRLFAILRAA
jgi:Family of unknown function (DUF6348)